MTTEIRETRRRTGATRFAAFAALALVALCLPGSAAAQWTAPDASGNINTTNTGNVGVGTTTPPHTVTVVKDYVGSTTVGVFNRTDGPGTVAAMGTGRTLDWSDKYITFGVTAPSFGVPGLNDVGIMHSKGVPFKFGSESAHDILFFTNGYNNTRMTIAGGGNVGIGTTTPSALLDLRVPSGDVVSRFSNAGGAGGALEMRYKYESQNHRVGLTDGNGQWLFYSQYAPSNTNSVGYFPGRVGVGTGAPTSALHVVGDITVTGNINAKYQDVAEWVPTTQKLAAGTVVVLDIGRDNHVAAATSSYDTRVAGVVSAQPGIALGEAGEGKVLVATTGRVKVKVDATQGPVSVGDLLVTSDRQGYAMKSEPVLVGKRQMHSPGTIIGKALEPLEKGTGEILVLLSLQ